MATGILSVPRCGTCGSPASRVETVAPGHLPTEWDQWDDKRKQMFREYRDPDRWRLLFQGIDAGNGWVGDAIDTAEAELIRDAFQEPHSYGRFHTAGFYDDAGFYARCDLAYCYAHWNISGSGFGHCPQGHGKSMDPHWRPD
jgi:hypothetical protein